MIAKTTDYDEDGQPLVVTVRAIMVVCAVTLATASYAFTWNSVSIALPNMQGTFSATTDQITWVMVAYIIGSAIATASTGWFSNRFGRRQFFLFVIAGFTLTQFGCAMSTSLEAEVTWRFIQGAMGAPMIPLGQVIAVNAFPKARYTQATSLWALGFISSNVISPTLAGYLVDGLGWPWVFYATVPVSTLCFIAAYFLIPHTPKIKRPMDWVGFLTLILGIGCFQFMMSRGERADWFDSWEIIIELTLSGLLFYIFAIHTKLTPKPFIPHSLFLNRDFMLGMGFVFVVGLVMYLPMILLPLQLQQLGGYPPSEIGYLVMSRGLGSIISLVSLSLWSDKVNPKHLMTGGLIVFGYGIWLMSQWSIDIVASDVMLTNFIMGLATGSVWAPMNTLTLSRLGKRIQDQGFALFYLVFDMGNAIGTALIVALLTRHSEIGHAIFAEYISPFNQRLQGSLAEAMGWDIMTTEGLVSLNDEITRQSAAIAFNNCYLVIAVAMWSLIPFILLFKKQPPKKAKP